MTDKKIVQALRCTSTPGGPTGDCEKCPYWKTEQLTAEQKEKLGVDTWTSCDVDKVGMDAADLIERLTAENAALREKVPQWIRCKDELPQPEQAILTRDKWGHIRDRVFHKFLSGPVLFRPDGLAPIKDVTHWMPLPEAPKEGDKA